MSKETRRQALKGALAVIVAAPFVGAEPVAFVPEVKAEPIIDPRRQGSLRVDGDDLVTEFPDGRVWRHPIATLKDIRIDRHDGEWTIITVHER